LANRTFRDDLAIAALPLVWDARLRAATSLYLDAEDLRRRSAAEAYALADAMLAARSDPLQGEPTAADVKS